MLQHGIALQVCMSQRSAAPTTHRASSVLPVPGGPQSRTPRGMREPDARNFSGFWKKSTISCSSTCTREARRAEEVRAGVAW
jgi:hypothetical protein